MKILSNRLFDTSAYILILIFSFFFSFESGRRGFFAFDQSIFFDGSYRVLSGQIPYKDFITPFGVASYWIQAIFFKLLGVSYFSYIFGAAFINVLATLCSILILRYLFPAYRHLSHIAGLITAVMFYPPFGTPWAEHTAFFFSFVGLVALLSTLNIQDKRQPVNNKLILVIAGACAFLSMLGKQNAALFFFPIYVILLVIIHLPDLKKIFVSIIVFISGFLGSLTIFLLWLFTYSDPKIFLQYYIRVPGLAGKARLLDRGIEALFEPLMPLPEAYGYYFFAIYFIAVLTLLLSIYNLRKNNDLGRYQFVSSITCVGLLLFQHIFICSTHNQAAVGLMFSGVIFTIGVGLVIYLFNFVSDCIKNKYVMRILGMLLIVGGCIPFYFLLQWGFSNAWDRKIQETIYSDWWDSAPQTVFTKSFTEPKLKYLKWAQPTIINGKTVHAEDLSNLFTFLKEKNENFLIFPDFTIFYGLLDVPSPQPILFFYKGLAYSHQYDSKLDQWIVRDLKKNNVTIMIIEEAYLPVSGNRMNDFPYLQSYWMNGFVKTDQIGIFSIYEKII